jgi:hypothetical protein
MKFLGLLGGSVFRWRRVCGLGLGLAGFGLGGGAEGFAAAPSAPVIVSVVGGNQQATVNFLAPSSNGGSAISYYTATAYQSGVPTSLKNTSPANSTTIIVTGLTNGTTYTFVVTATNTAGSTSAGSSASTGVVPSASSSGSANQDFKTATIKNLLAADSPLDGWAITTGINNGITGPNSSAASDTNPPLTLTDLHLAAGGSFKSAVVGGATPLLVKDPSTTTANPVKFPIFTPRALLLNDTVATTAAQQASNLGNNRNAMIATKTYTVSAGEISSIDGRAHVRIAIAPVLESGGHPYQQQPYQFVQIQNMTNGGATLYANHNSAAAAGVPWIINGSYYYTDWQMIDWSGPSQEIKQGDSIKVTIVAAGCSQGGHFGRAYINVPPGALGNAGDGSTSTFPIAYVSATGPANVTTNTDFDYTFTYQNDTGADISAAVVTVTLPAGTTYRSCSFPNASVSSGWSRSTWVRCRTRAPARSRSRWARAPRPGS